MKANGLFFLGQQFFLLLAQMREEEYILIIFLVRLFCTNKLFILFMAILYKKFCKNVVLREHILVFQQIILQLSLRFIAHLKEKKL